MARREVLGDADRMAQLGFSKHGRFHKVSGDTAYGWAFVSTLDGNPYFDTGDGTYSDHIPVDSIEPVSKAFMDASRVGLDMHRGDQVADVLYAYPMTPDIMAGNEVNSRKTGLMIGWRTNDTELLEKIAKGERTGFSIGGFVLAWDIVDEHGNVIESVEVADKRAQTFGRGLSLAKYAGGEGGLKRRVFRAWKLKEISLVDFPMQEPATVGVVKSARKLRTISTFAKGSVLTSIVDGHQHVVDPADCDSSGSGRTSWETSEGSEYGHDHAWVRDAEGNIVVAQNEGHTHDVDAKSHPTSTATTIVTMRARAENLPPAITGSTVKSNEEPPMPDPNNKADDTAALTKRAELAEKSARAWRTMTDAHRAHYAKLTDDESRDSFLHKSAADRDAVIKAAKDADPEVYTSKRLGRVFRASDDPTLVEMAKQSDKDAEELAKARGERDDAQFSKMAGDALGNLPFKKEAGKYDDGVALVKAIHTIADKDQRDRIMTALKAADAIAENGTAPIGETVETDDEGNPVAPTGEPTGNEARDQLDKMARDLATKENLHPAVAKRRLLNSDPKAKELLRKAQLHDRQHRN